jgi:hypothetical protein
MSTETIAKDLARHLDQRMVAVLHDFMDRCDVIGMDYEDATTLAYTILGHHAATAAWGLHLDEASYLNVCRWHYHRMSSYAGPDQHQADQPRRRVVSE